MMTSWPIPRTGSRRLISAVVAVAAAAALTSTAMLPAAADEDSTGAPVVFTTEGEIARAAQRVAQQEEPFYRSWLKTSQAADAALDTTYVPEQSYHHEKYFRVARPQAQDARSLALAARITGDQRYAEKAREILILWAEDALAGPYPGWGSEHSMGLVIGRIIPIFADAYAILWDQIPHAERKLVERWFKKMITPIQRSREIFKKESHTCDYGECRYRGEPGTYLGGNYFNNHLSAHNLGLLAIGYVLGDRSLVQESLQHPDNDRDLKTLIDGAIVMPEDLGAGPADGDLFHGDPTYTDGAPMPEPGEIWDRSRTAQGNGLHYSHLHLRLLVLQADIARNNGDARDWFAYTGPRGENLELPFGIYDDFLMTGDPGARTGYYYRSTVDYGLLPLYEIAHREYPENTDIRTLLESFDRVAFDNQTFGWTMLLTDGEDGLAISTDPYPPSGKTSWTFDHDGIFEGFAIRKAQATVSDGALHLTVDQADPGIVSPGLLGLPADEYTHVEVRMRNRTADTQMQIFFTTDDDTTFSGSKVVSTPVTANDDEYQTYLVDMRQNTNWAGRIRQIRIDPVHGDTTGSVSIDSVRVTSSAPEG